MDTIKLIIQAIKNRNLPPAVTFILLVGVGYIIFPADLIPDIGVVGYMDDILIAALMIGMSGRIIANKKFTEQNHSKNDSDDTIDI